MKVYFRELTTDDIPAIREISKDIWDGEDYVPHVIENWLEDESCMNYGSFLDEEKKEMVGFGRVKLFDREIAWLEGGRVREENQKQGIGRQMIQYALDYALSVKVKKAQYATSSKNLGSKALANYFRFREKKRMNVLDAEKGDILRVDSPLLKVKKLTAKEVKEHYSHFDIGKGEEISKGWSYKPLKYISDEDGEWYISNSRAILQKIKVKNLSIEEGPEEDDAWLVAYGEPDAAYFLVLHTLQEEFTDGKSNNFAVFCSPEIATLIEKIGFKYHEGEPYGVILFEKSLK
ncbi:MAG: GNAT family N-acetyltransferase [Promethearchaeota archaeon]|jgi:GNAT superfamily N-acetyltransferase